MSWARVLVPLSGGVAEAGALAAGAALAKPFGAELACAFSPADAADLMPWMGEGFMGGVQVAAMDSLRAAAAEGEAAARAQVAALTGAGGRFVVMEPPVWAALSLEARLSDVVVFGTEPARGRGLLATAFQQILMEERRPVLVARSAPDPAGLAVVAWDGGREASRAARSAIPWLQQCGRVVILAAPEATPRRFDPGRLSEHFAARGVTAEVRSLGETGEPGPILLGAVRALGANLLVAGAFGHPRFQQFIFGGTTKALLAAEDGPSLFLSH